MRRRGFILAVLLAATPAAALQRVYVATSAPEGLSCGNPGPQRDRHTGLAVGQARAVPIVAGNQSPRLDLPQAVGTTLGHGIDIFVRASDPESDPLLYFADVDDLGGLPPGAEFVVYDDEEDLQARFSWNPTAAAEVGEHEVRIGAFDGRGGDAVGNVRVSVCRFLTGDPIGDVVTAIFGSQPVACGSGDANGDGIASAADLLVPR